MDIIQQIPGLSKMVTGGVVVVDILANSGELVIVLLFGIIESANLLLPVLSTVDALDLLPEQTTEILLTIVLIVMIGRFVWSVRQSSDNHDN